MSFNTSKFKSPGIDLLNRCGLTEATPKQSHGIRSDIVSTVKGDATNNSNVTTAAGGLIVHLNPLMWLTGTISDAGAYNLVLHKKSGVTLQIKLKVYIESKLLWDITSWGNGETELSASGTVSVAKGGLYYIKFLCSEFPSSATLSDGSHTYNGSDDNYCKLMDPDMHIEDSAAVTGGEVVNGVAYSAYTIPFYTFKAPTLTNSVSNTKLNLNSSETKISSVSCKVSLASDKIGTYCVGSSTNGYIEYHYSVSKGSSVVASGAFSGGKFTGTTSNTSLSANLNLTDAGDYTVKISAKYTDDSMWWYGATPSTTTVDNLGSDSATIAEADVDINKPTASLLGASCCNIYSKVTWTGGSGAYSNLKYYVKVNTSNNSNNGTESNKTSNGDEVTISSLTAGTTYYGFYKISRRKKKEN